MSFKSQVRRVLHQLGLTFDANKNLLANISVRHGDLADIMQVADAGDGEIAVIDDEDALVVFRGTTPAVPTVFRRSVPIRQQHRLSNTSVSPATPTVVPYNTTFFPAFTTETKDDGTSVCTYAIFYQISLSVSSDATEVTLALEYEITPGVFISWTTTSVKFAVAGQDARNFALNCPGGAAGRATQLKVTHNGSGALTVSGDIFTQKVDF